MASAVFGAPITVETLQATGDYTDKLCITQRDCAQYAEKMMSDGGKDTEALKYLESLKSKYCDGISAKCLIYNATGTNLNFVTNHDWQGQVYGNPYPTTIMNGQWGAFLHVHPTLGFGKGSAGAVVYRSQYREDTDKWGECDWLYSWSIPHVGGHRVYTEIREANHFPQYWKYLYDAKLSKGGSNSEDTNYAYWSVSTISDAVARSVFKLTP